MKAIFLGRALQTFIISMNGPTETIIHILRNECRFRENSLSPFSVIFLNMHLNNQIYGADRDNNPHLEHSNNCFPDSWIGRDGPIPWPARSPDLTPLDFFVWGRAKELMHTNVEINTREELMERINSAFETMKLQMMLKITTTEVRRRSRACIRNHGRHFEHEQ